MGFASEVGLLVSPLVQGLEPRTYITLISTTSSLLQGHKILLRPLDNSVLVGLSDARKLLWEGNELLRSRYH